MATYGRHRTNGDAGYGTIGVNQLRGTVYGTFPSDGWVTTLGFWGGKATGTNVTARIGLYSTANLAPATLLGETAGIAVTQAMSYGGDGASYTANIINRTNQPQTGSVRVHGGYNYALGIAAQGSSLNHAMVPAASISEDNENFYYRSNVSGSLPSSFGASSSSNEGWMSAWVNYTANTAPTTVALGPSGLQDSNSVVYQGTFSDAESIYGDRMLRFQYQIVNAATNAVVFNSGWLTPTSAEIAANKFTRTRTTSSGVNYKWRCQVQDQFGETSAWSAYKSFHVHTNVKPTAATVIPSGVLNTTSIKFEGTFSDPDIPLGDKMSKFQFQVVNVSTGAITYNSGTLTATATEQTNKKFSRTVSIPSGDDYKWRCQVADLDGTWSGWTGYRTFIVNTGGAVDTLGGTSGKQNTQQPASFLAYWRHPNLNANMFQHRILQDGKQIKLGAEIPTNQPPNASLNASWATAFGTYKLSWGAKNLSWQVRARDSNGLVTSWSTARSFDINAAPSIPTNLSPSNSAVSGLRPMLKAKASDVDGDVVTVKARIKDSAGTTLQTRTMTKVGDWYEYQTTSTDLPTFGTFKWDAYSYDGTLYSGTQTVEASATKSAEATFIYANAPVVELLTPSQGDILEGIVRVTWEAISNQVAAKVTAYQEDGTEFFVWGWKNTTTTSLAFTASEYGWRRGKTYSIKLELRDSNGLEGTSETITFTIDYPVPSPIDSFYANPVMKAYDNKPSAIELSWNEYTEPDFQNYTLSRIVNGEVQKIATLTNPQQRSFIDLTPASGVTNEYSIVVTTLQGIDELESPPVYTSASVKLDHVILQSASNPDLRSVLRFDSDRGFNYLDDGVFEMVWGSNAPISMYGTAAYQQFSGSFTIIDDDYSTAMEQLTALRNLWLSKNTICYRDERGRRFFGKITKFSEKDNRIQAYEVALEITQTNFDEGGY